MASPLRQKITEFFGLKKSIVALLVMVVLVGLGEKMAERFLTDLSFSSGRRRR